MNKTDKLLIQEEPYRLTYNLIKRPVTHDWSSNYLKQIESPEIETTIDNVFCFMESSLYPHNGFRQYTKHDITCKNDLKLKVSSKTELKRTTNANCKVHQTFTLHFVSAVSTLKIFLFTKSGFCLRLMGGIFFIWRKVFVLYLQIYSNLNSSFRDRKRNGKLNTK